MIALALALILSSPLPSSPLALSPLPSSPLPSSPLALSPPSSSPLPASPLPEDVAKIQRTGSIGVLAASPLAASPPPSSPLPASPPSSSPLPEDVAKIQRTGSIGVLAETGDGDRARAGVAVLGTTRKIPFNARFRVASGTKAFTATVLLQLAGEDRLHLDDSVSRWLPRLDTRITVRHLLQHTSGLFDYFRAPGSWPQLHTAAGFATHRLRTYHPSELVTLALKHPLAFPPGTRWSYSNTNYILAGMLIEKITGRTWAQEVRRRILRPLGLRATSVPETDPIIHGPHARAYRHYPDAPGPTDVTEVNPSMGGAAGAIITSATDLNHFQRALNSGRLLRPAQLAAMRTTVKTDADAQSVWPGARYGLGQFWIPLRCGGGYWGHGGDGLGFTTRAGVHPGNGRSVVVSGTSEATEAFDRTTTDLIEHALC
ncbi:serine hydrolase domain-containing protein [Nonomuraea endophytica]|uniref:serine hydrolase domain-containing protein n=1 Tax=Nonomuraea endophytica TaxID=714136 RepID=UPI0037CB09F2